MLYFEMTVHTVNKITTAVAPASLHSVKFMNKIQYVHGLDELSHIVPMEHVHVPECVVQ